MSSERSYPPAPQRTQGAISTCPVLLPMTLVTGVFGDERRGYAGAARSRRVHQSDVLIVASGVVTLAVFFWQRPL
jgi:hypothetical protein